MILVYPQGMIPSVPKRLRLSLRFYKDHFCWLTVVITSVFALYVFLLKEEASLYNLILFKTLVMVPVFYAVVKMRQQAFAYYRNLSLPKRTLVGLCFAYDFLFSLLVLSACYVLAVR